MLSIPERNRHIKFDAIDCEDIMYVQQSGTWCCLRYYIDLKHVDTCMQCHFGRLERKNDGCKK